MTAAAELPVLDPTRCTGCGDCVAVCPTDCLAMAGPRPWMPRPADCISCTACELVCPTDAIMMSGDEDYTQSRRDAEKREKRI